MTTIEFIHESKRLVPYWNKYQKLAEANTRQTELDPVSDFRCRRYSIYRLFAGTPDLPKWCPYVLFKKALEWELCLNKYMEAL